MREWEGVGLLHAGRRNAACTYSLLVWCRRLVQAQAAAAVHAHACTQKQCCTRNVLTASEQKASGLTAAQNAI